MKICLISAMERVTKLQQLRMASEKNKIVENYVLEELRCINPDQSEIWTAKHRILKKNFTLKRVKYPSCQTELPLGGVSVSGRDEWCYQNILRETNILKRLICETAPRCHKMIKTSNNLYVVYDEFPHHSLADHLASHRPSRTQKIALMQTVAKALAGMHAKTVVLLNLSAGNIFLREKSNVLFGDWSMAREARMGQKEEKVDCSYIVGTHACLAKEVLEGGKWSYWSDVYSLGCLFQKIHKSGFLQEPQSVDKQLQLLIGRMLNDRPEGRPKLDEIIKKLQSLGSEEGFELVDSPRSSDKGLSSTRAIGGFRIKHSTSTPAELYECSIEPKKYLALLQTPKVGKEDCPSINGSKSVKSANSDSKNTDMNTAPSRKLQHKKSFDIGSPLSSYSRRRKEEQRNPSMDVIKMVSKKRNQAFFLLQLSEFVLKMWVCPQLGYMLLKYALLTLASAAEQWQKQGQGNLSQKERDDVTAIIASEKFAISSALSKLKQNLNPSITNPSARKELEIDSQISERFLKQKIIQFGKQMVVYCEQSLSDKASQSNLVDCLFKTYMILKKIEDNTYQKFWDKIYNGEYAFLHSQKYLKDEKQLGHRYLKSRIAEILRGK